MTRIDALKALEAKVRALTGRATFPCDNHDVEFVLMEHHKVILGIIRALIAKDEAGE